MKVGLSLHMYQYFLYCLGSVCSVTVLIVAYGKHNFFSEILLMSKVQSCT